MTRKGLMCRKRKYPTSQSSNELNSTNAVLLLQPQFFSTEMTNDLDTIFISYSLMFANDPRTGVGSGRVIPMTQKMLLNAALLMR